MLHLEDWLTARGRLTKPCMKDILKENGQPMTKHQKNTLAGDGVIALHCLRELSISAQESKAVSR